MQLELKGENQKINKFVNKNLLNPGWLLRNKTNRSINKKRYNLVQTKEKNRKIKTLINTTEIENYVRENNQTKTLRAIKIMWQK